MCANNVSLFDESLAGETQHSFLDHQVYHQVAQITNGGVVVDFFSALSEDVGKLVGI
jgi:hypothetical protein